MFVDKKTYKETIKLFAGQKQPSQILSELKKWAKNEFDIEVINFTYGPLINSGKKRLYLQLSKYNEFRKMFDGYNYDAAKQKKIADRFAELAQMNNYTKWKNGDDIFVAYNDFSVEIRSNILEHAYKEIKSSIFDRYGKGIWRVDYSSCIYIFYEKDTDIERNNELGISQEIRGVCHDVVKHYDTVDYFIKYNLSVFFDSHENVEKNYNGSLMNYYRDH